VDEVRDWLAALARETLSRLGFDLLQPEDPRLKRVQTAYGGALAYHQRRFEQAGMESQARFVADALSRGRFAHGTRSGVNLWEDAALAAMVALRDAHATAVFRERFAERVSDWQRRYCPNEPCSVEGFLADLWLPRERAGPRIETYQAHGPLDTWLRQVFISLCHKEREKQISGQQVSHEEFVSNGSRDPLNQLPSQDDPPDEQYARLECAKRLAPLIAECIDHLDATHRQVLLMSVVDGVQQKKIAKLYGVRDYKITRMKQSAIKRVVDKFLELASHWANMADESVRQCIDLLLEKFPVV